MMAQENPPTLDQDVLLKVLCYCDISTVLTAGLASQTFHVLSTSKQVWLALISDLHWRGFIDLLPGQGLDDLPVHELVQLAKYTVHGPRTWSSSYSPSPVVSRQFAIEALNPLTLGWVQLLPNGRFLLYTDHSSVKCLDTRENKSIWEDRLGSHPQIDESPEIAADMVDGGESVNIIFAKTYFEDLRMYIKVVNLDLLTGSARTLFSKSIETLGRSHSFISVAIKGNFAFARLSYESNPNPVMFIQTSNGLHSTFLLPSSSFGLALLPEHMVISNVVTSTSFKLDIWRTRDLVYHHYNDENLRSSLDTVERVFSKTLDTPIIIVPVKVRLRSYLSPLRSDSSILWIILLLEGDFGKVLVYKCHIDHSPSVPPFLKPIASWTREDHLYWFSYTSTSYAYIYSIGSRSMVTPLGGEARAVDLPRSETSRVKHLSTYSNALTYTLGQRLMINYYE